jgi:hypothetical protein
MRHPGAGERGFVLIWITLALALLLGCAGLAIDIGRMYVGRSEAQELCDSAALAAAVALNGTANGIAAAQSAVTASASQPWTLGPDRLGVPQVDFATSISGPWVANPASPAGYNHARVRASMPIRLYLLAPVVGQRFGNVAAAAVAAQVPQTTFTQGLDPYTAVSTDLTSASLGFTVGQQYSIQWPQFNGNRNGCGPSNPVRCFNSPPCTGDSNESSLAVSQDWSSNTSGYWGASANSEIALEILNVVQLQPVTLGQQIPLTLGNKNAESKILDERVNQDTDVQDNSVSAYLANPNRNGRRLIAIPIVNPSPTRTVVVGFGAFLLLSKGLPSNYYASGNGNDPFCAAYVGPYVQGSVSSGAAGQTGAFRVVLVQ